MHAFKQILYINSIFHFITKLCLSNIVVVYDDADLPCGTIRFRKQGSAGTHNGMRNIVSQLASTEFPRLRVGIGKDERVPIVDYVLSRINKDNKELIDSQMSKINLVLKEFIRKDGKVDNIDINIL